MVLRTIRDARKASGKTVQEAADHLGISYAVMKNSEMGKRKFRIDEIVSLVEFYGMTMTDVNTVFFNGELPNGN